MIEENEKKEDPKEDLIDDIVGLTYTNSFGVSHSQEEFILLFGNMIDKEGRMVAKLVITPAQAKRILTVLQENVKMYKEKFGPIAIPAPKEEEGKEA